MYKKLIIKFLIIIPYFLLGQKKVDLIIENAHIYTLNAQSETAEAMAIKRGKIVAIGKNEEITKKFAAKNRLNAQGKSIFPSFIDAHSHFVGYGQGLQEVNLWATTSWQEVVERVRTFAQTHTEGWLVGRGWDQNDWQNKEFPNKEALDLAFPNRPVLLTRIDGHAAIVNQKALDLANIKAGQRIVGGEIVVKEGNLTGILVDNAVDLVTKEMPTITQKQFYKNLLDAQKQCFAVGLTTVSDCGLDYTSLEWIETMQREKLLKMRMYVMLSDERKNYEYLFKRGKVKTALMNCRAFKLYADGALGSRGACLLHPYQDRPNYVGFLLKDKTYYEAVLKRLYEKGFQACTHAIGDSANRLILNIYGQLLRGVNDKRWRIEHAQVVNEQDFHSFGKFNIIPSVQPTHATSDMYWAQQRLGLQREKGAYAYKRLLDENGWLPLGTDFPVEQIDPLFTFFAAVVRRDAKFFPKEGYQMENALSREEALRGMTIWAAKAQFEEHEKGSLEVGKYADFVILSQDLMTIEIDKILQTKVLSTFLGGEEVFKRE